MDITKIKKAAEIAKSRTSDKRWLAAIDKAVAGVESGWWIITELAEALAITTECGKTYFANGACQCEAYLHSTACKHRALYRLYQIAAEIEETAPAPVSLAEEEIAAEAEERRYISNHLMLNHASLAADVAASPRANLIAEIENIWPRVETTPLAVALMARFGKNQLSMLDDDMLRRVRLAIAM